MVTYTFEGIDWKTAVDPAVRFNGNIIKVVVTSEK